MSTNEIESTADTRTRAERRRPEPKTYKSIKVGRYASVLVRCSSANGGKRHPKAWTRPSNYRSKYEPHAGAKELARILSRNSGLTILPYEPFC